MPACSTLSLGELLAGGLALRLEGSAPGVLFGDQAPSTA
jgi:hypothetical protein